ncbi:lysozyme [Thiofaba sp. EF100]|uniref:lysozyme n=1 Tax=Thiofaba sp. EF100 TaxID=3121274 RepID=UPI003221442D
MKTRLLAASLTLSALGLAGMAVHEGYRSRAYDDGVGVQTVGFGTTTRADGSPVKAGDTTTPERAVVRLAVDAEAIQQRMRACIGDVPLYPHEWDAFVSLAYNIGPSAFCRSTLVKRLRETLTPTHSQGERERLYAAACDEMLRWTKAGGRELPGLVKRRQAEHRLCREGAPMVEAAR